MLDRVGKKVAVGAVDLLDARAHEAREVEQRHAGGLTADLSRREEELPWGGR